MGDDATRDSARRVAEELWLRYYNRALYDRGLITRAEYDRMARRIDGR